MKISIKRLTPKNEEEFFDFVKRQEENDLNFFTRWKESLNSEKLLKNFVNKECNKKEKDGIRIVAKSSDGQIYGLGLVDFFKSLNKKHVAIVGTIVDKKIRGKGIGKQLLHEEIKIGKKFSKKKLRATVHEHNVESMNLHLSAGFKIEGKFIAEEFDGEYRNVMSLALFLD